MHLTMVVLGCFLLGQGPAKALLPAAAEEQLPAVLQPIAGPEADAAADSVVPATEPAAASGDEPVKTKPDTAGAETLPVRVAPARRRLMPPEMVAEALVLPPGSELTGHPLTLLTAVSYVADRRRQLEVVHAYWRLVEAVAIYHFDLDHDRQLQRFEARGEEALLLRAARASSAGMLREAAVVAVAAQHELAELLLLPPEAPLPLPADRPHVGPYRTHFTELFSMRTPPPRARLIDRTLPIRRQAIDGRALAVEAAQDAISAAVDAYRLGRARPFGGTPPRPTDGMPAVLACVQECLRQRQAFIASVCRYNHDIADYALAAAGPKTDGQTLVGMLIEPTGAPVRPLVLETDAGVEPAGYNQPVPTPAKRPDKDKNVPTPAPPRDPPGASAERVPTPATGWSPSGPAGKPGKNEPTLAPPQEETGSSESAPAELPLVPVEPKPAEPTPRTAHKPTVDARGGLPAPGLYPALVDATPRTQAKQLTLTLHWDRTLPEGIGEPVSLGDCLRGRLGGARRAVIEAYWLVRQRAAEYQVVVQQAEFLESLVPLGPQEDEHPPGPRLRSARLAAEAALHEAHLLLVEAQFELAGRTGRVSDSVWPMPSTVPHSGRYLLKLDAQPRRLAESWPLRRLAATIPGLAESVRRRATAVIEADTARAAAAASYQTGSQSIEPVLGCIRWQTEQTLAFLQTLTDYNRAIAEYALRVLAPETPSEKLVAALVVGRKSVE